MKLNFSIDVILGSCSSNKKRDETKRDSTHTANSKNESQNTTDKRYTVKWKPHLLTKPYQQPSDENSLGNPFPSPTSLNYYPHKNVYCPQYSKTMSRFFSHTLNIAAGFNYFNTPFVEHHHGTIVSPAIQPLCDVSIQSHSPTVPFSSLTTKGTTTSSIYSSTETPNCSSKQIYRLDENPKLERSEKKTASNRVGRRLFTGFQILELENAFASRAYLTRTERACLAQKVNLTECQIKTWFQNRRTKEKRRGSGSDEDETITYNTLPKKQCQVKSVRIPGHGIQVRPTYGPPDEYLKAAIVEHMKRNSDHLLCVK